MKAGCKLSRMFEQDKEQFQRPNKEVGAEVFQNRSVSEWKQSGRVKEVRQNGKGVSSLLPLTQG